MKQYYTVSHSNDFLQRKLDHYNAWLLNPKRKVEDGPYKGFPEEKEIEAKVAKGRAIMDAEREVKAAKPAKVAKTKVVAKRSRTGGPTKQERALEIYRANIKLSKDNMITIIREQLDMSLAGATTYYYNAKKLAGH